VSLVDYDAVGEVKIIFAEHVESALTGEPDDEWWEQMHDAHASKEKYE
jgi:hypothetical protein